MNLNNVNLQDPNERFSNLIDPLTFNTLLLDIYLNVKEVNEESVRQQFKESLDSRCETAKEVFEMNLTNIIEQAKTERL